MNQIFDVDIDKVNKPYLPLASGDWSLHTGISVAVSTGVVAVLLGIYIGSAPLLATLVGSLLLGIAYSVDLPFLRWKKYPVLAMGCILSVRYFTPSPFIHLSCCCSPALCTVMSCCCGMCFGSARTSAETCLKCPSLQGVCCTWAGLASTTCPVLLL